MVHEFVSFVEATIATPHTLNRVLYFEPLTAFASYSATLVDAASASSASADGSPFLDLVLVTDAAASPIAASPMAAAAASSDEADGNKATCPAFPNPM